jgi:hypothetical protein
MKARTQASPQNGDPAKAVSVPASIPPASAIRATLQSWKDIASELNRGIRTVQRWERTLGLPVRRFGKGPRCPVFAFKDELHSWLRNNTDAYVDIDRNTNPDLRETPEINPRVMRSLENFFSAGRSTHDRKNCKQCHSPMQFLKGDFRIYGSSMKWSMSVPVCPVCDGGSLAFFRQAPSIQ